MKIAIVGITGAVGGELRKLLELSPYPIDLTGFASPRSAGSIFRFRDKNLEVRLLNASTFNDEKFDIVFFAAGRTLSKTYAPLAMKAGALAIDGSSAFRMDPLV